MPRRSLAAALLLVFVLGAVVLLRQRAGALARGFGEALLGTPAATPAPRGRAARGALPEHQP
jgi:hypothetical protein